MEHMPSFYFEFLILNYPYSFFFFQNDKQNDKQNEWGCVRDSSGKPGAVGNREDLERIARPEGARPNVYVSSLHSKKNKIEPGNLFTCSCIFTQYVLILTNAE